MPYLRFAFTKQQVKIFQWIIIFPPEKIDSFWFFIYIKNLCLHFLKEMIPQGNISFRKFGTLDPPVPGRVRIPGLINCVSPTGAQ
jgi:hypothetical protein